jgi:hypothetical protein
MQAAIESHLTSLDEDVAAVDLEPMKVKLTNPVGEERWSAEEANVAELWYRRFLHLKKRYPAATLVPRRFVDKFWHTHILDTRKYANDCALLFGRFLHHNPYFGMNGPADAELWARSVVETEELFLTEFGESLDSVQFPSVSSYCSGSCSSPCNDS